MQEAECITAVMDERVKAVALLSTSVSSTVSSMRRNAKFTGGSEASLIEAFRWLRRRLRTWSVWAEVQPLDYLAPFLAVVRSDETSGPITATALTSLLSILSAGLVRPDAPAASEAMHALVDAVTHCRFEARRAAPRRAACWRGTFAPCTPRPSLAPHARRARAGHRPGSRRGRAGADLRRAAGGAAQPGGGAALR